MGHIKKTLSDYAKSAAVRFHMPGHKGTLDSLDITEIPQTDDLNSPEGPYLEAFNYLSRIYHSKKSYFITSGATLGIQTMVLYAKLSGLKVVAMRTSHMSVINACLAFNAPCEFLEPEFDNITGSYKSVSDIFVAYLESSKQGCAVIVTSPDYFGRCEDVEKICAAAQKSGSEVLCDEAHGSHFAFSDNLPESAGKYCSIWVNGAHKTLGALTQGAFLHCSEKSDCDMLQKAFRALNTSSPSHVIAASLEEAVIKSESGAWDRRAEEAKRLEVRINTLKHIKCAGLAWTQSAGYKDKDVTRVVIDAKDTGGGYRLSDMLFKKHNIQLEMADFRYAVAILTIYDESSADTKLFNALKELDEYHPAKDMPPPPKHGNRAKDIMTAWSGSTHKTDLEKSEGMTSAGVVGVYPPGTALILPGEIITREHVEYIRCILSADGHVSGISRGKIDTTDM